jgi:hypothetical protein
MIYEDGTKDGKERESTHVTEAIKTNNGNFALLYCRRCSDLRKDFFKSSTPVVAEVNLGEIDSDHFALIYSLLATHPDNSFDPAGLKDTNVVERRFAKVKLILIWTFVSLPSHYTSLTRHYITTDPGKDAPLDAGLSREQCLAYFNREREVLETELRDFHLAERIKFVSGSQLSIPMVRFFKDGSAPTKASERYMNLMSERVVNL